MARYFFSQLSHFWGSPVSSEGCVRGFALDSREVEEGDLFVALKGAKVDGHEFIAEAFGRGAVAALVSKGYRPKQPGIYFFVDDPEKALQALASDEIRRRKVRVVGVTGSVGKTTTKDFIFDLLSGSLPVAKSPGNRNSKVGLPQSILEADPEARVLLLEMGMTDLGHIEKLVSIAPPEIALITKLGTAHMDRLGSEEGIARAKGEIFSHPATRLCLLLEEDLLRFPFLAEGREEKIRTFGKGKSRSDGKRVHFILPSGEELSCELPFSATHFHQNFVGAALVAHELGVSSGEIQERAKRLSCYEKRFEKVERGGVHFLNDSYNASLEAFAAAMQNLPLTTGGRRLAVIGQMPELGTFSEEAHRRLSFLVEPHFDEFFCLGEKALPLVEELQKKGKKVSFFSSYALLETQFKESVQAGDFVYLKGANSLQLWRLVETHS